MGWCAGAALAPLLHCIDELWLHASQHLAMMERVAGPFPLDMARRGRDPFCLLLLAACCYKRVLPLTAQGCSTAWRGAPSARNGAEKMFDKDGRLRWPEPLNGRASREVQHHKPCGAGAGPGWSACSRQGGWCACSRLLDTCPDAHTCLMPDAGAEPRTRGAAQRPSRASQALVSWMRLACHAQARQGISGGGMRVVQARAARQERQAPARHAAATFCAGPQASAHAVAGATHCLLRQITAPTSTCASAGHRRGSQDHAHAVSLSSLESRALHPDSGRHSLLSLMRGLYIKRGKRQRAATCRSCGRCLEKRRRWP